jgi:hypothetical protein
MDDIGRPQHPPSAANIKHSPKPQLPILMRRQRYPNLNTDQRHDSNTMLPYVPKQQQQQQQQQQQH